MLQDVKVGDKLFIRERYISESCIVTAIRVTKTQVVVTRDSNPSYEMKFNKNSGIICGGRDRFYPEHIEVFSDKHMALLQEAKEKHIKQNIIYDIRDLDLRHITYDQAIALRDFLIEQGIMEKK